MGATLVTGAACSSLSAAPRCLRFGHQSDTHLANGLPDGTRWIRDELAIDEGHPSELGAEIADRLLAAGAGELLELAEGS